MPTFPKRVGNTGYAEPGWIPLVPFAPRQNDLAILANHHTVRADERGRVVDEMPFPLDHRHDDVKIELLCQGPEELGRGSRHRLGALLKRKPRASARDGFAQHHEVGPLPGGFFDQRDQEPAVALGRLATAGKEMDRGQPDQARR